MELQQIADDLLTPLWRCLDNDYKEDQTRRGNNVWQQFEHNIQAAATTTDRLSRFIQEVVCLMPIAIREDVLDRLKGVLGSGEDRQILRALRMESVDLMVRVRIANQERNERRTVAASRSSAKAALRAAQERMFEKEEVENGEDIIP